MVAVDRGPPAAENAAQGVVVVPVGARPVNGFWSAPPPPPDDACELFAAAFCALTTLRASFSFCAKSRCTWLRVAFGAFATACFATAKSPVSAYAYAIPAASVRSGFLTTFTYLVQASNARERSLCASVLSVGW